MTPEDGRANFILVLTYSAVGVDGERRETLDDTFPSRGAAEEFGEVMMRSNGEIVGLEVREVSADAAKEIEDSGEPLEPEGPGRSMFA